MDYEKIVALATEITNNDNIDKNRLTVEYKMTADDHKDLDQRLFYRDNPANAEYTYQDVIEFDAGEFSFRFIHD
jgi:hypothetical protein|tara:strand:- start:710 stop:931 length:222 start_codon:yes stop_codon:yes gene_type:complete